MNTLRREVHQQSSRLLDTTGDEQICRISVGKRSSGFALGTNLYLRSPPSCATEGAKNGETSMIRQELFVSHVTRLLSLLPRSPVGKQMIVLAEGAFGLQTTSRVRPQ